MECLTLPPSALFTCPPTELGFTGQSCLPNDRKSELALDYTLPVLPGSVAVSLSPLTLPSTKSGYQYSIGGRGCLNEKDSGI